MRGCRSSRALIKARLSSYGAVVFPAPAPCREHQIGIVRLSERAVIPAERAEVVALLQIEVEAQDRAAVGEVGAQVKQIVPRLADQPHPEGHHLHVAARAGARHGVLAKAARSEERRGGKSE